MTRGGANCHWWKSGDVNIWMNSLNNSMRDKSVELKELGFSLLAVQAS